jgi:predicted MFS family arabinose efflux permease
VVSILGRAGAFWLYAAIGLLALVFVITRVPETRGRSLEEIQHQLGAS